MARLTSVRGRVGALLGTLIVCVAALCAATAVRGPALHHVATASAAEMDPMMDPGMDHGSTADDAPDPDAPAGAPLFWLPKQDWILDHWLPYDHRRLLRRLHVDVPGLIAWVHDDVHTLAQLAERHHQNPQRLADYLVKPWRGHVSRTRYATLRTRTMKTLTQSHLAHHIFGHLFHVRALQRNTQRIYGADLSDVSALRSKGLSFEEIGARNGRSAAQVRSAAMDVLRESADRGVRHHDTPKAWRHYWLGLQAKRLPAYLEATLAKGGHEER